MATKPPSPSTLVDIDPPPDIPTPSGQPGRPQMGQRLSQPHMPSTSIFYSTPTQPHKTPQEWNVRFASTPPADNLLVQVQSWEQELDLMHLCTPSETTSPEIQHGLPGFLPTPGKEIHHLTTQLQGNWDRLFESQKNQEKSVSELTHKVKQLTSRTDGQLYVLTVKMESNHQQLFTTLTATKQQEETETDQFIKAMRMLLTEKLQKTEVTMCTEFRFMVEQLQLELQQDIKTTQRIFQKDHEQLSADVTRGNIKMDELDKKITELQLEMNRFKTSKVDIDRQSESSSTTPPNIPASPIVSPAHHLTPAIKSDHLRLTFPTFGRSSDDTDPLLYLARCQDFALHPLADIDILATFRTVLHGTARDWWEVARSSITTRDEFETAFLSAFLSEDYEDELAERVRTRTQGEKETIRDFAFTYRALCKRWKPTLTETEVVKLILKNIKPHLASQLRSRVTTVEELVKLGHQLEKDYEQQQQYGTHVSKPSIPDVSQKPTNRPADKSSSVRCWRCKGYHAPGNCPHYSFTPENPQHLPGNRRVFQPHKQGSQPTSNAITATTIPKMRTTTKLPSSPPPIIPPQLVVPVCIGVWAEKAIVDTGASYTMVHEKVWKKLTPHEKLQPWTLGPLYLANGEAEVPLGWIHQQIHLHDYSFTLPIAVLSSKALAYSVVLGLDFIFFSGMQINVMDRQYFFKSNPEEQYSFQPGNANVPANSPQRQKNIKLQSLSLLSAIPPQPTLLLPSLENTDLALIENAVNDAHLPPDGKRQLQELLEMNTQVCTLQIGRTDVLQHFIYTSQQVPIKQKPYRMSPVKQALVKEQLEEMLKTGIVEPSHSGWASPVVLVPKKDGSMRFCVDYRKLNAITETDAYPLPNIAEILESLSGAAIFSTIDLNSGYWQVAMDPLSKQKTAFITPSGLFQFNVMPFGLRNAPATFQRLMETVLGKLRGEHCFVYIDDIIIYSSDLTQHLQDLQTVFHKLQEAGLTINLKKSKFCLQEISFLGHVVNTQGIMADPSKVEAIRSYPVPTNLKEVQRFLGLAGWYHRFVPNFSQIAEPINALKKKGKTFHWSDKCQQAFEQFKACLSSPPILSHPNLQHPFTVYTDASDTGLRAVLTQRKEQGMEEVIAYASRSLNPAETNYSVTEKECLAVIWALEKWQHYLEYRMFTVVTDHSALQWVMFSTKTTGRLIRWALRLQKFDFVIEYRKGKLNAASDALSRMSNVPAYNVFTSLKNEVDFPITAMDLWEEQHKDPEIQKIFKGIAENKQDTPEQFEIVEDKLYIKTQLAKGQIQYRMYLPKSLIPEILQHYHSHPLSGHGGIFKTYKHLQDVVFWPKMWTDVKNYVKCCKKCQTYKYDNRKPAGKLQPITTTRPMEMLGVDIMGPLPSSSPHRLCRLFLSVG